MPWGILEDKHMEHVPGTVILHDQSDIPREYQDVPPELLKKGKGDLVLAPQPSSDPNDPLNWPTWKKDVILAITGLSAGVVGAYGPMLSPGFVLIADHLGITVDILAQSIAWTILTIGLSLFVFNPIAKLYGRRPVYLACSVIMLSSCIWGSVAADYPSFLWSRIWGGFGMAPYEILVQCTIGDMYFVHQRGTRIAIWNMFLLCGISGGGLIAGYIIENQGWKWTLIWCAIFFGVLLPLTYFLVPETAYNREPIILPHTGVHKGIEKAALVGESLNTGEAKAVHHVEKQEDTSLESAQPVPNTTSAKPPPAKHTFARSLRIVTGRYTTTPLWKIFLRPAVIFFYPAVFWAFLLYGATLAWIVVFSVVNASIFTFPPYNFSVSQTGLISLSPFILTLIGELVSGPLNDWLCVRLAKRNKGVYEPEFRLPLVIVPLLLGVVGFYGFGATVHFQTHWLGPVLCFGFANMALAFMNSCVFGYVIDAHGDLSEEAFVAINARNLLTFGLTYFVNDWLARAGALSVFNVLGSIFVAVMLTTIPLWVYGKRARGWIARNEALQRFMHED